VLDRSNELRRPYQQYVSSQVWRIIEEIPEHKREQLREDIKIRAAVMGTENTKALKAALKHLGKEKAVELD